VCFALAATLWQKAALSLGEKRQEVEAVPHLVLTG
jgi:hypothetical protein